MFVCSELFANVPPGKFSRAALGPARLTPFSVTGTGRLAPVLRCRPAPSAAAVSLALEVHAAPALLTFVWPLPVGRVSESAFQRAAGRAA